MGRPNNQAGCTKFGKLINGQDAIRMGRVSNFSEINKRACPFIRQVRVVTVGCYAANCRNVNTFLRN